MLNSVSRSMAGIKPPDISKRLTHILTVVPELTILLLFIAAAYVVMGVFSKVEGTDVMSSSSVWLVVVGSFIVSTAIAVFAVLAGIGGGVIFTPLMMGFTSIDTLVIRSTGLVVAMFSGLISTGPFMRKGLCNVKLIVYGAVPITVGAAIGANIAIVAQESMGATGDALVRLLLGLIIAGCCVLFIKGGGKYEYPDTNREDRLGQKLGFNFSYFEESLGKDVTWQSQRVLTGGLLLLAVGFMGGFFGLGGGWALTPVLNMVMGTPLKVSAASSGVLLAISDGTAAWKYLNYGALIAVFAAPWMLGQIVGGIIGAHALTRIRVSMIRYLIIFILGFAAFKLVERGIEGFTGLGIPYI
ncbi:sulfite exporter TauE/SafE family protein [Chloroflexota bacterium]